MMNDAPLMMRAAAWSRKVVMEFAVDAAEQVRVDVAEFATVEVEPLVRKPMRLYVPVASHPME
jgi:hypothetical protein